MAQQLKIHVTNAKNPPKGKQARFYMFDYLLEVICAQNSIPGMSWTWSPKEPVVHIYCKLLSECSYKGVMEKLTEHFLIPLYNMIFEEDLPCMSREKMEAVSELAGWFASPNGTYLRVFGGQKSPHLLPRYATDKLVMKK